MALNHLVVLVGGVGGAKLAYGLAQQLTPEQLTIIVNVGDDFTHYGLHISPDIDTIMYTLAGVVDKNNGWGVAGDTTQMLESLRAYGEDAWFRLGDHDIATHILRTSLLQSKHTLTSVTARLASALGVKHRILPATDDRLRTLVSTAEYGELEFQQYFVRYRWQPTVQALRFDGAESAQMTAEVRAALQTADAVIFAPSNPYLSIAPILAVQGVRELLCARDVPRVAVTPIIAGKAIKGPAAKLMLELGFTPSSETAAHYYGEVINAYVTDQRDPLFALKGLRIAQMDTLMQTEADRVRLASEILSWIRGL